jgi:hypothetical protein
VGLVPEVGLVPRCRILRAWAILGNLRLSGRSKIARHLRRVADRTSSQVSSQVARLWAGDPSAGRLFHVVPAGWVGPGTDGRLTTEQFTVAEKRLQIPKGVRIASPCVHYQGQCRPGRCSVPRRLLSSARPCLHECAGRSKRICRDPGVIARIWLFVLGVSPQALSDMLQRR